MVFLPCLEGCPQHADQDACVALHPGTVETDLSRPFLRNGTQRTFSAQLAVRQLIPILADAAPEQNGAFLAWNGAAIPW